MNPRIRRSLWAGVFYRLSLVYIHSYMERDVMTDPLITNADNGNPMNPSYPPDDGRQTGLMLKAKPKTRKPAMYKVLLLNDDFTPMEFVVHVLERFFSKNKDEATEIMLHVHRRGVGLCGVFTYEVAETKVMQVMDFARANEQPLQCTMEKE